MTTPYTITLRDGKYTVINTWGQPLEFRRYGEAWPGADSLRFSNVVHALADRIQELEEAIKAVLDGTLMPSGARKRDGLTGFIKFMLAQGYNNVADQQEWETILRKVLEQKP